MLVLGCGERCCSEPRCADTSRRFCSERLGCTPRSGIARWHSSSVFNLLKNLHTVFYSGRPTLHSRQRCRRGLVCISLTIRDVEHLLSLSGHLYIIFSISGFPKYIFREKCTDLNVGNEWILFRVKAGGAAHTVPQLIALFITGTRVHNSSGQFGKVKTF